MFCPRRKLNEQNTCQVTWSVWICTVASDHGARLHAVPWTLNQICATRRDQISLRGKGMPCSPVSNQSATFMVDQGPTTEYLWVLAPFSHQKLDWQPYSISVLLIFKNSPVFIQFGISMASPDNVPQTHMGLLETLGLPGKVSEGSISRGSYRQGI